MKVTTVGVDLAKHIFQAHGIDAEGKVLFRSGYAEVRSLPFSHRCRVA
jgi:transposase